MPVIPAVVTNLARTRWPQMIGGLIPLALVSYFKVGEGGWFFNPVTLQREPRTMLWFPMTVQPSPFTTL